MWHHRAAMPVLLVVEDGHEYEEFARAFLHEWDVRAAHSAREAVALAAAHPPAALLVDLRFERSSPDELIGDVVGTARRRFAGDSARALRYLREQQGTLVLGALREAGVDAPAVFVTDFAPHRLANLRQLYGRVQAVPVFDAAAIRRALESA
jgi:ActR/RegA family two-component response regulator